MNYWQEKTKTEIVVISKDELKELIREVLAELNVESQSSHDGWMNAMQAARYSGVSRSFLHKIRKEGKIKGYQHCACPHVPVSQQNLILQKLTVLTAVAFMLTLMTGCFCAERGHSGEQWID